MKRKGFEFRHLYIDFPFEKLERIRKEHSNNIDNIKQIKVIGLDNWLKEQSKKAEAGQDIHVEEKL